MNRGIKYLIEEINSIDKKVKIMEVCGTHTHQIYKNGIIQLLNNKIELVSGPGCPVCVTHERDIDYMCELAKDRENIIVTYGDMMRVQGSNREMSLEKAKRDGAHVKMVYSSLDALEIAKENINKRVIFLGIGFETTIPATCKAIKTAESQKVDNFKVLSLHKAIKPVMELIMKEEELGIDGFLIPGHVASIIGEKGFNFLNEFKTCSCITGFNGDEILFGLYIILKNLRDEKWGVFNGYKSAVRTSGNLKAMRDYNEMFKVSDDMWRGIGRVEKSAFKLKNQWEKYDIERSILRRKSDFCEVSESKCRCGEVLKGKIRPNQCREFGKECTPLNPMGPCMISSEGSCSAFYKYNRD